MHIPNEIVLAIVRSLRRSDLKTARLVSKTWCVYVSALLFKKIYVAPNKLDFEAFEAITRHPVLSKCVRQLVYDGSAFTEFTKTQYIAELQDQTVLLLEEDDDDECPLEDGDQECVAWIEDCGEWVDGSRTGALGLPFDDLVAKWEGTELITQGYRKYREHAIYQQISILSGDFTDGLVQGLAQLPSLESIILEGRWPYHVLATLNLHRFGSPLARTWDPFHLCPRSEIYGVCHYQIIIAALVRAKKQIHEFVVDRGSRLPGIHPCVFDRSEYTSQSILGLDITAFAGLKRLYLAFARFSCEAISICNIGGLQKLLASTNLLQRLDLTFPMDFDINPLPYRLHEVFPDPEEVTEWKCLESMSLQGIRSGVAEFLSLVLFKMPALKSLGIGDIELKDGSWEAVIEVLKQSRHLSTFEIAPDTRLIYNDDGSRIIFECSFEAMENYVEGGGRHPCLKDGQPDSAANLYMMDEAITPALRQRLVNAPA